MVQLLVMYIAANFLSCVWFPIQATGDQLTSLVLLPIWYGWEMASWINYTNPDVTNPLSQGKNFAQSKISYAHGLACVLFYIPSLCSPVSVPPYNSPSFLHLSLAWTLSHPPTVSLLFSFPLCTFIHSSYLLILFSATFTANPCNV